MNASKLTPQSSVPADKSKVVKPVVGPNAAAPAVVNEAFRGAHIEGITRGAVDFKLRRDGKALAFGSEQLASIGRIAAVHDVAKRAG